MFFSQFRTFFKPRQLYSLFGLAGSAVAYTLYNYQQQQHQNIISNASSSQTAKQSSLNNNNNNKGTSNIQPKASFYENVSIFCGNANRKLAEEITEQLGTKLGQCHVSRFADGEVNIRILDNVRGKDIYIIQPTCPPVNENLMELLLLISTMKRASARKINVVIPYYGYSRQDRKVAARVPISAADVAKLISTMGADRVISIDLHCGQIQGFFPPKIPVDNLEANKVALQYFFFQQKEYQFNNLVIVSPDAGGVTRAKNFQEMIRDSNVGLNPGLAMIIKHREIPGQVAQMYLVGEVANKDVIIVDDMIDTAGTLSHAVKELKGRGAKKVFAFATHGLFSGNAFENIQNSVIDQIVVTNTIPQRNNEHEIKQIKRLTVAPLLAEAIKRIQQKESVSKMFQLNNKKN